MTKGSGFQRQGRERTSPVSGLRREWWDSNLDTLRQIQAPHFFVIGLSMESSSSS